MLPHLLKLLPDHEDYIEVFGGGATLLLNKEPSKFEVYNDLNNNLVTLFRIVKEDFEGFSREVEFFLQSRQMFKEFKRGIGKVDDVKKAAMYYYRLRTSFDGKAESFSVKKHGKGSGGRPFKLREEIKWIHERLHNVVIENMDFAKLIEKYDDEKAFYFCDPPYYEITGLYELDFSKEDHLRFFKALKGVRGKFLVTYGDHEFIRLLWRKFPQLPVSTTGSMGTAEKRKTVNHLLIANYDIAGLRFKPFTASYFQI